MSKILVTGATGFIGKHLVNLLLTHGHQVRVLIRDPEQRKLFLSQVECVIGNITQPHTLRDCCAGIDVVYHLAGLAHDNNKFVNDHVKTNFYGTYYLLQEATRAKIKNFIYFSSVKAEDNDTPYGMTKRKAEELILHGALSYHFQATILRPSLVYGPGCKGNLLSMLRAIDKGFFVPIPETKNQRSMISIGDVCNAAIMALDAKANGKIYYLTDGNDYSTRQMYELMSVALNRKIPRWHVPLVIFKMLAKTGDIIDKLIKIRMPFNSMIIDKMFGSARYDANLIQLDLNFTANDNLSSLLPAMVAAYKGN